METIKLRYAALQKALLTLQKALDTFDRAQKQYDDFDVDEVLRGGVIQAFQYCLDTFWKFIKLYLEEIQKISIEFVSPKEIFKKALNNPITPDEHQILTKALTARNLTSHSYNEELAINIQQNIPAYLEVMQVITNRIKV